MEGGYADGELRLKRHSWGVPRREWALENTPDLQLAVFLLHQRVTSLGVRLGFRVWPWFSVIHLEHWRELREGWFVVWPFEAPRTWVNPNVLLRQPFLPDEDIMASVGDEEGLVAESSMVELQVHDDFVGDSTGELLPVVGQLDGLAQSNYAGAENLDGPVCDSWAH